MAAALAAALTHDFGYRFGGATVGDLITRPIPRELWSGKPRPVHEQVVARVWPQFYPGLNPAFSPLLSFYWDLGIAGVAIGMALFGFGARGVYDWFRARETTLAAQLLFSSSLWFVVIGIRNDPVDTAVFALFLVAPVIAIGAVSDRSGRLAARLGAERRARQRAPGETATAQDHASR